MIATLDTTCQHDYQLSDLDTPFPRTNSRIVDLDFENGSTIRIKTNLLESEFKAEYQNKLIELCYYAHDRNQWTQTSRLIGIRFIDKNHFRISAR